jgi:7-cyano-7-deazaguanine synthase
MKKAVVLLSGGLDSATVCLLAKRQDFAVYALSFLYGQRHNCELDCAKKIAQTYSFAEHKIANIDLTIFAGSALTSNLPVPKNNYKQNEIPITYVPARNTIFLSYALAYAESIKAYDIFLGVNAIDYSGYPDCRPQFIDAFASLANLGAALYSEGDQKLQIHTPLLKLSKADIVRLGFALNLDFSITNSCYDPIKKDDKIYACGACDSCFLRQKGFAEAGIVDTIIKIV